MLCAESFKSLSTLLTYSRDLGPVHVDETDAVRRKFFHDSTMRLRAWINRLASLFHDISFKALFCRIDRGTLDAIVECQTDSVHMRNTRIPKSLRKSATRNTRVAERRIKRRVHLDSLVVAFFDNVLDFRDVEFGDEFAALGVLDTMVGPESRCLRLRRVVRVGDRDGGFEGLVVWRRVVRSE